MQDALYNPLNEHNKYKQGILWIENRLATQEECDQLNKEALEDFLKNKDDFAAFYINEKYKGQIVYSAKKTNLSDYPQNLASSINLLTNNLNWQPMTFLFDYAVPWLSQDNDYKPVIKTLDYLRSLGIDDNFAGGFLASGIELKEFLENLFWLVRCNASLPVCYFAGVESESVLSLCQYGNVHFEFYSEAEKLMVQRESSEAGLLEVRDGNCIEEFSRTGSIKGRQIKV